MRESHGIHLANSCLVLASKELRKTPLFIHFFASIKFGAYMQRFENDVRLHRNGKNYVVSMPLHELALLVIFMINHTI